MAIQILGLRDYFSQKTRRIEKTDTFLKNNWRASSVKELFTNIESYISQIPEEERYNLYYTAASCAEKRGRIFQFQEIIPIDIDNIDIDRVNEYPPIISRVLGVSLDDMAIIFSGNGIQAIIMVDEPWEDVEFFDQMRIYYKGLLDKISDALKAENLEGELDPSVFSRGRLLRLPMTENRKQHKPTRQAYFITRNLNPVEFNLIEKSGVPVVAFEEQISDEMLKFLPPPDVKGVLEGCDFIKWCKASPNDVSEPQWYALLSIIGRLENGIELAHEFSSGYSGYNEYETDKKIQQAIRSAGPRTCDSISTLWDGCPSCINYQKCKSPIVLQSKEYIKTKDTGFYHIVMSEYGPKKGKPDYEGLMKYFEQKHNFVTLQEGNMTYIYTGTHWEAVSPKYIHAFAEEHFDPKPTNTICNEFQGKIQRNNLVSPEFFEPKNMMNFKNGILMMDKMELAPHSSKIGFKYVLPFDYDSKAECPRFLKFLEEVTLGDKQVADVLVEYMGYALSGTDPSIGQKALILLGDGSNGKSVFMDVLKYLAGKNNYSTLSMGNEINKLENRYQLDGKLFNISEETPTNAMVDNSVFKALVSGGEVQSRKLYCDAYSMKNNAKIIMACNELPYTGDVTHGMFRRLIIAPFKAKFDKNIEGFDPMIRDKLFSEASGIYNLALKGLERFRVNKSFTDSDSIDSELKQYQLDNDPILSWFRDMIVPSARKTVCINDCYLEYKIACENMNIRAKPFQTFCKRIRIIINDESKFDRRQVDGTRKLFLKDYAWAREITQSESNSPTGKDTDNF